MLSKLFLILSFIFLINSAYAQRYIYGTKIKNSSNNVSVLNIPSSAPASGILKTDGAGNISGAATKSDIGLGYVDNTSDTDKPVSTAQQAAINTKMSDHVSNTDPHPVYALDSDLASVLAGTSAIPTSSQATTTTATSASTTFVDVATSTITLAQANVIHGVAVANFTTSATATDVGFRVSIETPEVSDFTAVDDVACSTNSKYVTFTKTTGAFYVWYNCAGGGVDPAPGGTGIVVAISSGATASTIASATITALASHGGVAVSGDNTKFRIINSIGGNVTDSTVGTTGFSLNVFQQGAVASNGQNHNVTLSALTTTFSTSAQHFFSAPSGGIFLVKGQMQRVSGTGTVTFTRGTVFGQAQQAYFNPLNPSRIIYVAKNGSDSNDGTWTRPYLTIGKAVLAAHSAPSDYNTPIAILVAPGNGSTTYSETAPISITKGGIAIINMGGQGFKPVNTALSGSFVINWTSGANLFFDMQGFEINVPSGAAWNTQPSAVYVTGTSSGRVHISGMVVNSNASTRHALYCDNASATLVVDRSELKAGVSGSVNIPAVNMVAGNLIAYDTNIADRQSGNIGIGVQLANNATATLWGGDVAGKINKTSNTSSFVGYNGVLISSGVNSAIVTQASVGAGAVLLYDAILASTATYAVSGSENVTFGKVSYTNTFANDPLLVTSVLKSDINQKYSANASDWAATAPDNVKSALDRISSLLKTLNGGTPIP